MMHNGEQIKRIYIRADGNDVIATGHIMRCLSIAAQIRKQNAEVVFVTADDAPCTLIEDMGYQVDVLETKWNDLDSEIDIICDYAVKNNVKVFIIDSYYVTEDYLKKLSEISEIVYIDDLLRFAYPVNTIINYGVFTNVRKYWELYEGKKDPRYLIGGAYIPLREEFKRGYCRVGASVNKVLITTGGTDEYNIAGTLLDTFMKHEVLKRLEYHVISGCFNKNRDMLRQMAIKSRGHIYYHENVNNMSEYMSDCDVAISAAGSTLYELCSCGTPTICLEIADNQRGAEEWQKRGYMLYAGNVCNGDGYIDNIINSLLWFRMNYDSRVEMSNQMLKLIDGGGAMRIAEYVIDLHDHVK